MECNRNTTILGCSGLLLVGLVVLLAFSFATVEPTEWAIKKNKISKQIDKDNIYDGGRHLIGPLYSFITFPATYKTIEFSDDKRYSKDDALKTTTKEGLVVYLHVSFQYQLIRWGVLRNKIGYLYDTYNVDYETQMKRTAKEAILQVAGAHNATEFWVISTQPKRQIIGEEMENLLNIQLNKYYAQCIGLQILKFSVPASLEDSIIKTQVENQNTKIKGLEQEAELKRQDISVKMSETQRKISVLNSEAESRAYYITQQARAKADKNMLDIQSYIYQQAIKELGFSPKELAQFLYLQGLQKQANSTLVIGVDKAILSI